MKRILFLLTICLMTLSYSQTQNFRCASLTSTEIENINERPDFDFNAKELRNLPVADLLNIYVEEYINVAEVKGHGKQTTLLSLEIDDKGVLKNVSATGENQSFNREAVQVFDKFKGTKMNIRQLKNADVEVLIPISLEL